MLKNLVSFGITFLFLVSIAFSQDNAIIADHNSTDLSEIPNSWILKARRDLVVSYGHKNHGGQIITGMHVLKDNADSLYLWDRFGGEGSGQDPYLCLISGIPEGQMGALGFGDWIRKTGELLNPDNDSTNVVMWSWAGWMNMKTEEGVRKYLEQMDSLERSHRNVHFIYMTGHLEGTGEDGKLNRNNNIVRSYCIENGKMLYDFADLESYDPDGNYFLNKGCDDRLDYDGGNWADEYCERHPDECGDCPCYITPCINCQLKAKAFWWILARIAGWQGGQNIRANLDVDPYYVNFGEVSSDEVQKIDFVLNNNGNRYCRIKKVEFINNQDSVFSYSGIDDFPVFVNATTSKTITVKFTPPEANGDYAAFLKVTTDLGENNYNVSAKYTGGVGVDEDETEDIFVNVYPNPSEGKATIAFNSTKQYKMSLEIYDLFGKKVFDCASAKTAKIGRNKIPVNCDNFSPGVYYIRLTLGNETFYKKLVLTK